MSRGKYERTDLQQTRFQQTIVEKRIKKYQGLLKEAQEELGEIRDRLQVLEEAELTEETE